MFIASIHAILSDPTVNLFRDASLKIITIRRGNVRRIWRLQCLFSLKIHEEIAKPEPNRSLRTISKGQF